jgi:hypothetical protein
LQRRPSSKVSWTPAAIETAHHHERQQAERGGSERQQQLR